MALSAVLATAGFALGQAAKSGTAAPAASAAAAPKAPKLVRVTTLNGAQAVQEFQANVQLVQAQRQGLLELTAAMDKETDAKKKKDLKTQIDAITAKLTANNAAMMKTYGFTLARNYTMEIETANIYLQVTDDEAAKIDQAQKEKGKEKPKK